MMGELQFQHEYLAAKSRVKRWLIVYNQTQPNPLYTYDKLPVRWFLQLSSLQPWWSLSYS